VSIQQMSPDQERIGALLTRLRRARGWSQLTLAEKLCVASETATVSRHEISRWERGQRTPGPFWLGWLALVLDAPLGLLEAAVANTRGRHHGDRSLPGQCELWQPPAADDLLAALDHPATGDIRDLAHAWLAGPPEPTPQLPPPSWAPALDAGPANATLRTLEARLGILRRLDDHVGGRDLSAHVDRDLRVAVATLRDLRGDHPRRNALRMVAGFAQLAGWAHADAGNGQAAHRAYRVALHAASAADDRPLAAHVLGALSHHLLHENPHQALLLARTGYTGARTDTSPLTQALLLQRVALAAAHAGQRCEAELALAKAEQVADRSHPEREPPWLYWLDTGELQAMTGRCLAAAGRPLRAAPLLADAVGRAGLGPRTAALYAVWLTRCQAQLGEVERACATVVCALTMTVASGSARVAADLKRLHPLLLHHRDLPAVRRYEQLFDRGLGVAESITTW
jgi:transcriptional regulator with XRE-family HTH domain